MALADILMLTFNQTYGTGGEKLSTIWFFLKLLGAGGAEDLVTAFMDTDAYVAKINQLQAQLIKNASIRCINLGDDEDFFETAVTLAGNNGTACMPAYAAVNFTKKLNTRAIRPGSVRIPGIDETYVTNGIITEEDYITVLEDSRAAFATALPFGGIALFDPIVVKRVKYTLDEGLDTERDVYRLPETDEEAEVGRVTACLVNLKLSHQVSRGNGR